MSFGISTVEEVQVEFRHLIHCLFEILDTRHGYSQVAAFEFFLNLRGFLETFLHRVAPNHHRPDIVEFYLVRDYVHIPVNNRQPLKEEILPSSLLSLPPRLSW